MPTISPVLRITIGLLLLTISLLLMGDLLGIVPDQKQSEIDSRKVMAESLAIQVSSEIGENRIKQAVNLLNIIVNRNQKIKSIGLRTNAKQLLMQSDKHELLWSSREDDHSTPTHIQVPIYGQQGRWGTLEVSFTPLGSIWSNMFTSRSFTAMILFVFIFGFITYWLFLRRVLSELDPGSVVPDRVRSALDVLNEGLVILDTNEKIVLANSSLQKKLGLPESKLIGKRLSNLQWEMESDALLEGKKKLPWNILLETDETPTSTNLKLKSRNDNILTFDVNVAPIRASGKKIKGVIVTIDDVTELEKRNHELGRILKRLEKSQDEIKHQNLKLTELATRDPLTNALNRRSLFEGLNNLLSVAHSQIDVLSCIMLDIDHFKSVNDNYGHGVGDTVIRELVKVLQKIVRPVDLVARYGGEEFVVVLPGLDESEAAQIAEKMRVAIFEEEHNEFPENLIISSSFGVASTQDNIWESDKLVDSADKALYIAKSSGRNRVICYSQKNIDHSAVQIESKTVSIKNKSSIPSDKSLAHNTIRNRTPLEKAGETPTNTFDETERSSHTLILDRLTQAINMAQRNKISLPVLTIFIDTIQLTNNTLGYASAEKLKKIAFTRLTDTFRVSDSVIPKVNSSGKISLSRSADSEFTAILSGMEKGTDTTWAIYRMFKALSVPIEIDGNEIVMTANIGVSVYPNDSESSDELLANSKMALEKAKKEGRGEFLFFNQDMSNHAKEVLKTESQLHQALERKELYLNFQPIVDMKTGQVKKIEALLRWKHPELGSVSPRIFIEIAEHAGIIKEIGKWVIKNACQELQTWVTNGYPHLTMSINLSAVQFHQASLAEDIIDIVKKEGVSPESIVFELTETVLLKNTQVTEIIFKLHAAGFKIALDDFGTGYSSLEHLRKFPIDWIKIDGSFMTEFPKEIHAVSIVSGLISLSHNLGMRVIAEGVETESQLSMLYDLNCDAVQGYLMSKPLSAEDTTQFLTSTSPRRMLRRISTTQNEFKHMKNNSLANILNLPPDISS